MASVFSSLSLSHSHTPSTFALPTHTKIDYFLLNKPTHSLSPTPIPQLSLICPPASTLFWFFLHSLIQFFFSTKRPTEKLFVIYAFGYMPFGSLRVRVIHWLPFFLCLINDDCQIRVWNCRRLFFCFFEDLGFGFEFGFGSGLARWCSWLRITFFLPRSRTFLGLQLLVVDYKCMWENRCSSIRRRW